MLTVPTSPIVKPRPHPICSIWPTDRTLSGATTPSQSGTWGNGNEGVLHIPQSSNAGASPSDGLISYLEHLFGGDITPQQRCSQCILQPHLTGLYQDRNKQGIFFKIIPSNTGGVFNVMVIVVGSEINNPSSNLMFDFMLILLGKT